MATIYTVQLYLSRDETLTAGSLVVKVYDYAAYTSNPTSEVILGTSDAVVITDVPIHGSPSWVVFSFSTPITITNSGFYGIMLGSTGIDQYGATKIRWYGASDWSDAATGSPYTNKERAWYYNSGWVSGGTRAYLVIITDANWTGATVVNTGEYITYYYSPGLRSYVEISTEFDLGGTININCEMSGRLTGSPPKASNPSPANLAGNGKNILQYSWSVE